MIKNKGKIVELDIFRSFAIMAVISIHASSQTLVSTKGTTLYYPFIFLNIFSKFAVPVFIFLSGFVLFYNYIDRPLNKAMLKRFYTKRLLYILVPYVIVSAFYFFTNLSAQMQEESSWTQIMQEFGMSLLTGTAHTHLYYVIIMLQLYILFPFFLWWFQKQRSILPWVAVIGLLLQWLYVYLNKYGFHLPEAGVHPQGIRIGLPKGSVALSYMFFYLLGAWIAIYYEHLKNWLIVSRKGFRSVKGWLWVVLWVLWAAVGVIHAGLYYLLYTEKSSINSLWYEFMWDLHSMLSCLVLMQLSFIIYRHGGKLLRQGLSSIGMCSFGIYLMHPYLLSLYQKYLPIHGETMEYALRIAAEWMIALVVSWAVVYMAFRYIPWSWIWFGSAPASLGKSKAGPVRSDVKKVQ